MPSVVTSAASAPPAPGWHAHERATDALTAARAMACTQYDSTPNERGAINMGHQPIFSISTATREDIRSLGIQKHVDTLPQDAEIAYYRVQVDQAAEWMDVVIIPTGALVAWGAGPGFLEGLYTPEDAVDTFFTEDDDA
jgi:hypothetical protein